MVFFSAQYAQWMLATRSVPRTYITVVALRSMKTKSRLHDKYVVTYLEQRFQSCYIQIADILILLGKLSMDGLGVERLHRSQNVQSPCELYYFFG